MKQRAKARELLSEVVNVMADVLVHQRARWGALLGHQRQFEGWWKAEMALALESWTWRADRQETPMKVQVEPKPGNFSVARGPSSADLVVAPMNSALDDLDYLARPRVWVELKERGTWWGLGRGAAAKAFGDANKGLRSDLAKWRGVSGDGEIVLICQITMHDGSCIDRMPESWSEQLNNIASTYKHALPPRCVGYELAGDKRVRWTRFDAFVVHRGW